MLNRFKIAETDTFSLKMSTPRFNKVYKKIRDYVYPQLCDNPLFGSNLKKLKSEFEGIYRYRIGNYRLFYTIESGELLVMILDVDVRKDAYR